MHLCSCVVVVCWCISDLTCCCYGNGGGGRFGFSIRWEQYEGGKEWRWKNDKYAEDRSSYSHTRTLLVVCDRLVMISDDGNVRAEGGRLAGRMRSQKLTPNTCIEIVAIYYDEGRR